MKAIIDNKSTYEVTGERGDFYICKDVKGKVKMFAKKLVEVVEINEMQKAKVYKKSKSSEESRERQYKKFKSQMREAEFQENYLECQRPFKY